MVMIIMGVVMCTSSALGERLRIGELSSLRILILYFRFTKNDVAITVWRLVYVWSRDYKKDLFMYESNGRKKWVHDNKFTTCIESFKCINVRLLVVGV